VITNVLVALDTSPRAPKVLDAAVELARTFGARMRLFRGVELPPDIPPAAATHGDPVPPHVIAVVTAELRALERRVEGPGVVFGEPIVRVGRPWRTILEVARELDVDLIVVGSHGFHGWDRVLGTNAARIANFADRNVFVVHPR
jgi:nucleotide-binding universal stress UspA family protein